MPELALEITELLVGQRLERSRIDDALSLGEREVAAELADNRLAGARRRRDDDGPAVVQSFERLCLEVVERERKRARYQVEGRLARSDAPSKLNQLLSEPLGQLLSQPLNPLPNSVGCSARCSASFLSLRSK